MAVRCPPPRRFRRLRGASNMSEEKKHPAPDGNSKVIWIPVIEMSQEKMKTKTTHKI